MKRFLRGGVALVLAAMMISAPVLQAQPITFFEERQATRLSNNTYLIETTRITNAGLMDINVLQIPLDDPYLRVGVFNSTQEFGLKQSVTSLLNQHNAFAGVNGDFFGLAGRFSSPLGLEIIDGEISAQDGVNAANNASASFLMGNDGVFMEYVRPQIDFLLDGERIFHVGLVNMVSMLGFPSFLTHGYIANTADIDNRVGRAYKLVVENGVITSITADTVDVPQNGFIVIMDSDTFWSNGDLFYIGQRAEMEIISNVDLEAIHTALSGEHRILYDGEIADIPAMRANGRMPRTILGLNEAQNGLILMTIDGRGDSVGATFLEAAHFMREFGAYNAIALDGGGSTTMAARLPAQNLAVVNTPSEGWQRNVINAFGVANHAPLGELAELQILGNERIAVGLPATLSLVGFDTYMSVVDFPIEAVEWVASNATIADDWRIIAHSAGDVLVTARIGEIVTVASFEALEIAEIVPSVAEIRAGSNVALTFTGIDNYGRSVPLLIDDLHFQVHPPHLGEMVQNLFVSVEAGNGWLGIAAHNARKYIPIVDVLTETVSVEFGWASFAAYPINVSGGVGVYDNGVRELNYGFVRADFSQAAMIDFEEMWLNNPSSITLDVYGNNSYHWLRGALVDEDGNSFVVDFVRNVDFYGWQEITVDVPSGAVGNLRLERIWVVSLGEDISGEYVMYFRNVRYERHLGENVTLPASTVAMDSLRVDFVNVPNFGGIDAVFAGHYEPVEEVANLQVISLNAARGGIVANDAGQWGFLAESLINPTTGNVVIHTNLSPLEYINRREFEVLHGLLRTQVDMGLNVFVVSHGGQSSYVRLIDGVRYVHLAAFYGDDGEISDNAALLRLRVGADGLQYDVERVLS
ncbi:MAG: phosphodiester glycosidase family protein [Defluviitaleaceae bacterium]|nr:phosphodiester glycosidase family protein [Defluviitaleaceae bacterium]